MTVQSGELRSAPRTAAPPSQVLLNPGPVNVDERVREVLRHPDVCHREPEAADLMRNVRAKATAICGGGADHTSVLFAGSGTAALEAVISSVIPADGKLLVLHNGHYAERVSRIAAVHGIAQQRLEFGWTEPFDLDRVDAALAADPGITHVGMVHHETSTGMLNPLSEVGLLVARHGRSLLVDAISSLGAEELDVVADHVDWCVGTANKCLEGLPGASFACAPRALLEQLATVPPRTFYLDLHGHYTSQEHVDAPLFTPAVQALYALDRALDLSLEETVPRRSARYAGLSALLREHLVRHGLEPLLAPEHSASSVTVFRLPEDIDYTHLHDRLKDAGFVIYGCPPPLGRVCRIATMGNLSEAQVRRFLDAFDQVVAALRATASQH